MSSKKLNVVVKIESYSGNDTFLEVGGEHLEEADTMYGIVTVYDDGATIDLGYGSQQEAITTAKQDGVPVVVS